MKEDGSQVYWEKDGRSLVDSPLSRYNFKHGRLGRKGGTSLKIRDENKGFFRAGQGCFQVGLLAVYRGVN